MAFLQPDRVYDAYGVKVKQYFITEHNPNRIQLPQRRTKPLIGLTLHNTNDIREAQGTTDPEQYTRATVNGNMGTVRVHFYVDDVEAWQTLPLDYQSWHCGQQGRKDANGSERGNAQTISIECIMSGKNTEADRKAEDNAARLIAYLLDLYGMTADDNLYTHNYWCNLRNGKKGTLWELNRLNDGYKGCPIYVRPHWYEFKTTVQNYMRQYKTVQPESQYIVVEQLGAYSNKENADKLLKELKSTYPNKYFKILKVK